VPPPLPILRLKEREKERLEVEVTRAGEKASTQPPILGHHRGTGTTTGAGVDLGTIHIKTHKRKRTKVKNVTHLLVTKSRRGVPKPKLNSHLQLPLLPVSRKVRAVPKKETLWLLAAENCHRRGPSLLKILRPLEAGICQR
jgi:hypothetical protein